MLDLFDDWHRAETVLRTMDVDLAEVVDSAHLVAPLGYPRKVICAGVNYRRHIREMGAEVPGAGWRPFFFLKPPTTSVIGPHDPIPVHAREQARYDWEAELAVSIGVGGQDIPVDEALEHVAGYAVANDVTARGTHVRDVVLGASFVYDWFGSKAIDGSFPWGPVSRPPSSSMIRTT